MVGLLLLLVIALSSLAPAAADDERFVAGLRERRLFKLAESYCEQQLAVQDISAADRALFTIELLRVHTEHALNETGESRQTLWATAGDLATTFEAEHADNPRLLLVRVQRALALLALGELERMEAEVGANRDAALDAARATLRDAADLFADLEEQITAAMPVRAGDDDALTADELVALILNVQYQAARVRLNQALCYPPESSDRVAALNQVQESLTQPLLNLADTDPLAIACRLEQVVCLRLLGDLDAGEERLAELALQSPAPKLQLRLRAEAIRLRLAEKQLAPALKIIGEGRELEGVVSPELDFAFLQTYVGHWRAAADAQDDDEIKKWREQSVAAVKFIEQTHGRYWARRGELLLIEAGQGAGDGSVEILGRTADDLYRKGKLEEALVAYDKAVEAARGAGNDDATFQLAYKAALLQQGQQDYASASQRFQELAVSMPKYKHAANAHVLAVANWRQAVARDATQQDAYRELLDEHLQLWPTAPTASAAAMWLGQLHEQHQAWHDAIVAYERVARGSKQDIAAIAGLERCWLRALASATDPDATSVDASRALTFLDAVVLGDGGQQPETWSEPQRAAVLASSRIRVRFTTDGYAAAEALLDGAKSGSPEPSAAWAAAATPLLVLAVAGQPGREGEARDLIQRIGDASPAELLDLLRRINAIAKSASEESRSTFAQLQLDVIERLQSRRSSLAEPEQRAVDVLHAEALASSGDSAAAITAYADLARRFPNSGAIQEGYATLLLNAADRASWQAALPQWRRVAARTKPRTPRWFRAKYSVALTQFKLGDKNAAAKLIRYLDATEDLVASGMQSEFAELLKQCE